MAVGERGRDVAGGSAYGSPVQPLTLEHLAADPHAALAELRAQQPVAWIEGMAGWLVTARQPAVDVMRDPGTFTVDDPRFTTAQVVGPSMLSLDGREHSRHRDPFKRGFRLDRIRAGFDEPVRRGALALLEPIAAAGRADLRTAFTGPLAVRIVAELLGLADVPAETVLGWYRAIVGAVSELTGGGQVPAGATGAVAELNNHLTRSLRPPHGAGLLAAALGDGDLTEAEVLSNAAVIMFGGIDTTDGMLANAIWHLLRNPAQLELVLDGRASYGQALEESLRLEPAAAFVDRYARREISLAGAAIAAGDLVRVSISAANRDPATFPEPDRFDVRRANARHHVAFAHGPHVCLGMHLARLEGVAGLELLFERLAGLRLEAAAPPPEGLVFRRPAHLPVRCDAEERAPARS